MSSSFVSRRPTTEGFALRSTLILLLLVLIAGAGLWTVLKNRSGPDLTLGGPLMDVSADRIEGIILTRARLQYRFAKDEDGNWSLSGSASDYLNLQAMNNLTDLLAGAVGGPVIPGTDIEDRRYEFNGPAAVRVTVFTDRGEEIRLAIGAPNPVTGNYYASGAGRKACFTVPAALRERLAVLPQSVQASTLLPLFDRETVTGIRVDWRPESVRLERLDGNWWLRVPSSGIAGFPDPIRRYHEFYDDRRQERDSAVWIQASAATVQRMIYEVSSVLVREFLPTDEAQARIERWDLDPPWRRVVLEGNRLTTDPRAESPDRLTIAFGLPLGEDTVPALRRGNVLLTDFQAVKTLDGPISDLVDAGALGFTGIRADEIKLFREEMLLLHGTRTGDRLTGEGRAQWVTIFPEIFETGPKREGRTTEHHNSMTGELMVELDRMPILAVLPPHEGREVLLDEERVRVSWTWNDGAEETVEFGFLAPGWEQEDLVRKPDALLNGRPVAAWSAATGSVLQVPIEILTTARSLRSYSDQPE